MCEPQACRSVDEGPPHRGDPAPAPQAHHHPRTPQAEAAGPARSPLRPWGSGLGLGIGHHLHPHRRGLAVSGCRARCGKAPAEAFDEHLRSLQKLVLQRLVEPGQYLSIRYTERLAANDIVASVGSRGDDKQRPGRGHHRAPTRPNSCATAAPGAASTISSSPPWNGSIGHDMRVIHHHNAGRVPPPKPKTSTTVNNTHPTACVKPGEAQVGACQEFCVSGVI